MPLFFINYDLEKPEQEYAELLNALGHAGAKRAFRSGWVLRDASSVIRLNDTFQKFVGKNDRLIVIQLDSWASRNAMIDINKI